MYKPAQLSSTSGDTLPRGTSGFTLVELIAVILLLGVLSTVAASRMVGSSSYLPSMIAREGIAFSRLAQQHGASRQDAQIQLVLDAPGSDWRFRVVANVGGSSQVIREETLERKGTAVRVSDGLVSAMVDASSSLEIDYDGLGGVAAAKIGTSVLDKDRGIDLTASGDSFHQLCIEPTGFAALGPCD